MKKNKIITIDVFSLFIYKPDTKRNEIVPKAQIRVICGEIIWMNTNVLNFQKKCSISHPDINIPFKTIELNQSEKRKPFNITHRIDLKTYGFEELDNDDLYINLSKKDQIKLGLKNSKRDNILKCTKKYSKNIWASILGIAILLGLVLDVFDIRDRISTRKNEEVKKELLEQKLHSQDSLKNDSL